MTAPSRVSFRPAGKPNVRVGSDVYSPVSDSTAAFVMVALVVVGVALAARILA